MLQLIAKMMVKALLLPILVKSIVVECDPQYVDDDSDVVAEKMLLMMIAKRITLLMKLLLMSNDAGDDNYTDKVVYLHAIVDDAA